MPSNRPHSRSSRSSGSSSSVSRRSSSSSSSSHSSSSSSSSHSSGFSSNSDFSSNRDRDRNYNQGFSSGGFYRSGSGSTSRILPLIIIAFVAFVLFSIFSDYLPSSSGTQDYGNGYNTNTNINTNTNSNYTGYNDKNIDTNYASVDTNVNPNARDKFTTILGGQNDVVTLMVYVCGADLESNYGMATSDINEILYASDNSRLNIIIQTGGAKKWQNSVISNQTNQRYLVTKDGLQLIDKNVGDLAMTDPDTLEDFVKYCSSNYPANRYQLVMWDHGGGSVTGYGYDEKHPNNGSMSVDEIANALKNTGVKFDFIGFDACLMQTLETAIALEPYSDYLIASEETEPGTGWYYTGWVGDLAANTAIPTLDLSKVIIDDYIADSKQKSPNSSTTLSIIDLAELHGTVGTDLVNFAKSISTRVKSDNYQEVVDARADTREFAASSRIDQIDLVNFALNLNDEESKKLATTIQSAIKYNRQYNLPNSYGMSVYFPYSSLKSMNSMVKIYDNIDMDSEYSDAIKSFATLASSGQIVTNSQNTSTTSILNTLMGSFSGSNGTTSSDILGLLTNALGSSSSNSFADILGGSSDWVDSSLFSNISNFIGKNQVITNNLEITQVDGQDVIHMEESQWNLMKTIELNVFVDDGEGYIDLGLDNLFSYNDAGDLIVDYDKSWLSIGDHIVAYYVVTDDYTSDDDYLTTGRIPAYLNGQLVDIMVSFSPENPYGKIDGAKVVYDSTDTTDTIGKGLIEIQNGDAIDFICKYYSYKGEYRDDYLLGEQYIVNDDLELYNTNITNTELTYSYRFTDIYGNYFWTPSKKTK